MSSTNWIELVVAIVSLAVVALSAWAETSLAAVSRVDIRRLLDNRLSREDAGAIERTQRLRSSVLLVEVLASGVSVALFTIIFQDTIEENGLIWGLAVALGLLIIFGRLVPRALATEDGSSETSLPMRVARIMSILFAPVIRPVEFIGALLAHGKRRRYEAIVVEATEAGDAPSNGSASTDRDRDRDRQEPQPIEEDEQDMISGVLHLEQATARQIMVPRIDIVAVARETLVSEAVDIVMGAGHSRIPVYGRSIDEIVGVIYAKDLLRYVNEEHEGVLIDPIMRPAYFVPESKRVDDLLNELQQSKIHIAVVVDEYGGTAGVVTIEDILEEIVGEIQDEYDREPAQFELVSDTEAIADGRLSVHDLVDEMDLEWPGPASGTLGGFIQRQLGRIPSDGEVVEVHTIRLTVLKVEHHRVRQVRVERISLAEAEESGTSGAATEQDAEAVASQFP